MPTRKRGERVLGPYKHGRSFRVIEIAVDGSRERRSFPTEAKAREYIGILNEQIDASDHTTETALEAYVEYLEAKGNKPGSVKRTRWSIGKLFPKAVPLWALRPPKLKAAYAAIQGLSVDSHRNALAEVKTFLAWCVTEGLMATNPAEETQGIGRRKKRKAQLRFKEARTWYARALAEAKAGEDGALAALMALLLGMRASEIINVRVRDLDEEDEPLDTIWIPDAKTEAGKRTIGVPEILRPFLEAQAKGKKPEALLFPTRAGGPHWRDWPRENVQRICDAVKVPPVTAHGMRGLLATLTLEKGTAGHMVAQTLGHEDIRTTVDSYAKRGSKAAGDRKRGLIKLDSFPTESVGMKKKSGDLG